MSPPTAAEPLPGLIDLANHPDALGPGRPVLGRDDEVAALARRLLGYARGPDHRLVVVAGPGGVGKTAVMSGAIRRAIRLDRSAERLADLNDPEVLRRQVDNPERFFHRFFLARPDWLAGVTRPELERTLDALNALPQTVVLYATGLPAMARRLYGGPPEHEMQWLTELFLRRENLACVTEETEDRPGAGREWAWWRREQRVEVGEWPTGRDSTLPADLLLAHTDPRDPTAAGPYLSPPLAGRVAALAREFLPNAHRPGVLVDFLAGVRRRSTGREATEADVVDEVIARTGLPGWRVQPDEFAAGLSAATDRATAVAGGSASARRLCERLANDCRLQRAGIQVPWAERPRVLLLPEGGVRDRLAGVTEPFYGPDSLIELDLARLPPDGFEYFHQWAGRRLRGTAGRVFLLTNPERAPERYLMTLGGYLKNLWDWAHGRVDDRATDDRHMRDNYGHDFRLGASVVAVAVTSPDLMRWVRTDWQSRVVHDVVHFSPTRGGG